MVGGIMLLAPCQVKPQKSLTSPKPLKLQIFQTWQKSVWTTYLGCVLSACVFNLPSSHLESIDSDHFSADTGTGVNNKLDSRHGVETFSGQELVHTDGWRDAAAQESNLSQDAVLGNWQLGTGIDEFVPLVDGQTIPMIQGAQGGYHIWGAVAATNLTLEEGYYLQFHVLIDSVLKGALAYGPAQFVKEGNAMSLTGGTVFLYTNDAQEFDGMQAVFRVRWIHGSEFLREDSMNIVLACCEFQDVSGSSE